MEKDKETKATEEREGSQVNQNVVDFGSAMTKTAHGPVYTLAIIGQIEGHTAAPNGTKTTQYEHMLPLLAKLEESREVDGILFLLNTVGGNDSVMRQTMEKMRKYKVQLYSDRKVIRAAPKCHSCLSISPVCKRKHTR